MNERKQMTGMTPVDQRPSRPRPSERETRAPLSLWDRLKFLVFLAIIWLCGLAVVWTATVNPLGGPFSDALRITLVDYVWVLVLMTIEAVRQLHYLIEEHSKGYYRFWEKTVFGGLATGAGKMDPWVRYRMARALKTFILLFALSTFLGRIFNTEPVWLGLIEAPARLVVALPFILQLAFSFFFIIFQFVGLFWFLSRGGIDVIQPDEVETRFEDVKGQDSVINQLRETLVYLERPEMIEAKGGYVPGGVLLWGPPGTGKTMMAKAIAGETGKPFVSVEPAAFIQMFMGIGPLKVKGLYRKLRRLALRYGGVIVFFDEADSLGSRGASASPGQHPTSPWTVTPACNGLAYITDASRNAVFAAAAPAAAAPQREGILMGGMMGGGGSGVLQALLSEMSGLEKPRGLVNRLRRLLGMRPKPPLKYRILHMFATNMPEALDPAMLRPGRIDRQYKVGYPQKQGRRDTFVRYLAKVSNAVTPEELDKLATITPYFSGAMIEDIVNEALVIAIRAGRDEVTYSDVIKAKQVKQHGLPDDHEYIERERHSVAVHEACHAVAAYRLRRHAVIDMATIERRGDIGGFVASIPPEDQFVEWRSERETDVMTFLASLAGERLFFEGDHSTGVGGDMRGATTIATQALAYYAMGDTIAARSVNLASIRPGMQAIETGADRALFDSEFGRTVDAKLHDLYDKTWELLEDNRNEILAVAHALEMHKTLTGEDIAAVIDGTVGPTVDGRAYQDPSLQHMLENYHAAVVRAHREHGGVASPIPVPIPPPPAEAASAPTTLSHPRADTDGRPRPDA